MAGNITIDDRDFQKKIDDLKNMVMPSAVTKAIHDVASEVLRLSGFEVPHDKGMLQNSGSVEDREDESIVGYNKVYAARLHEHPEYRFNKGRKGKFLEDPIKNNMTVLIEYIQSALSGTFK